MLRTTFRILAIDPGFRRIGYALLEGGLLVDFGVHLLEKKRTLKEGFIEFERTAQRLIADRKPDVIVIEHTVFSQSRTNIRLAIAVQVLHRLARARRITRVAYNPRTIRKAVCGNGNATKRDLARMIVALFPQTRVYLESNRRWREQHFQVLYDAIACALTHERQTEQIPAESQFVKSSLTK